MLREVDVVDGGVFETVTHDCCTVVGMDSMNALSGGKAKRVRLIGWPRPFL